MSDLFKRYQDKYLIQFVERLGNGKDGDVLQTNESHAVKFLFDAVVYRRERGAYELIREMQIEAVNGFNIPQLVRHDDELRAIEMTIVQPPFLLDFASAYTDEDLAYYDFTDEVMEEREAHWSETFGDRWAQVRELRDEFARLTGLTLLDLSLYNVKFE